MSEDIGIHEKVELLGQSFDIQTELVDAETATVRTVIFHHGEVAAHREGRLASSSDPSSSDLEARLREHHGVAIERFVKRTLGFEARAAGAELAVEALPVTSRGEAEKAPVLPPIPEDPALADTIEVRQLVGKLLSQLDLSPIDSESQGGEPKGWRDWIGRIGRRLGPGTDEPGSSPRLEKARLALSWAVVQPGYRRVRMDEQVQFRLLRQRLDGWNEGDRESSEGDRIWQEVVTFCDYLREINLRSDLVDFDRSLLDWALSELSRESSSQSVLRPLRWLRGRDADLDALIEGDGSPATELLRAELERVRSTI